MTQNAPSFRSVIRGYDRAQVDAYVGELLPALEVARREMAARAVELSRTQTAHADLSAEVDVLRAHVQSLVDAQRAASQPIFTELGSRIGKMLQLAEQEATEMRAIAAADAADLRATATAAAEALRGEAARYSDEVRAQAESDAASLLDYAHRRADEVIDESERAAHTRREEAEALYESQRATVSAAAADFETTLAQRRDRAAADFAAQLALHDQQLTEARSRAEALTAESQQAHLTARREADLTLQAARTESAALVRAAHDHAERVRTESEHELAAVTSRRDSINSQLANVRQMLATLGEAALSPQPNPEPVDDVDTPAGPDVELHSSPTRLGRDEPDRSDHPAPEAVAVDETDHLGHTVGAR